LDISGGQCRILRPGATPKEAIEEFIGPVAVGANDERPSPLEGAPSPGLLKSHYAPRIPLLAYNNESLQRETETDNAAFLFFDGASRDRWLAVHKDHEAAAIAVLSETGNTLEAASHLFETLHELDRPGIKKIHVQYAPEEGLGVAINDRLRRAAK
jgi:L-threonylcarbamoyladenylate synthase